ncbi:hypothetical protein [Pseudomonas koreensis]|uniref:Uncharacterized protein n=1 Tax=Pseudomonas koreensis TaxID=198620 RepID=A0A9X2XKF2_9PSED|nr:hypothetical protein [Pseudomonas koreensis]
MNRLWPQIALIALGAALLALVWWGWHQGGLAMMQLGLGSC